MNETKPVSDTLRNLWHNADDVPPRFDPEVNVSDAMAIAQCVTTLLDENEHIAHQFRLTYLELLAVTPTEWAATFSCSTWNDPEWYETRNIVNHPHSARANTAALAISRAAVSLVPLIQICLTNSTSTD